jgi:hypothetical protein
MRFDGKKEFMKQFNHESSDFSNAYGKTLEEFRNEFIDDIIGELKTISRFSELGSICSIFGENPNLKDIRTRSVTIANVIGSCGCDNLEDFKDYLTQHSVSNAAKDGVITWC